MIENKRMSNNDFLMLWGFILFVLGAIGAIQIGILEGINAFLIFGGLIMITGVILLCSIAIKDKLNS